MILGQKDYQQRRKEYEYVFQYLNKFSCENSLEYNPNDNWLPSDIIIISGGATGADTAALDWAVCNYTQLIEYPADWKKHGRAAGFIRNQQMINEGKPDICIAFPGGNGTADMINRCNKAGIPVKEVNYLEV